MCEIAEQIKYLFLGKDSILLYQFLFPGRQFRSMSSSSFGCFYDGQSI